MPAIPDLAEETPEAKPVFVDPSGRRRRIVRRVAIAAFAGVVLYLAVFVAALFGAPIPPSALIPVPGVVPAQATSTAPPPSSSEPAATHRTSSAAETTPAPSGTPRVTTTSVPPTPTTATPATTDRRNTHAPTTPPGQARTTSPGNGHQP